MSGKRISLLLSAALLALLAPAASAAGPLQLTVVTGSPEGFHATSTLISGATDAVLIDGQFTVNDASRVVTAIQESGKNLTAVYVTHAHPDHYFGLNLIRETFPKAHIVALPSTLQRIRDTWKRKVSAWKPTYRDQLPSVPVIPSALEGTTIVLEGEPLEVIGGLQGDDAANSFVWVPSLGAIIAGDIVFNGVHPWTAETSAAERREWMTTLDRIAAFKPDRVVAGHKVAGEPDSASAVQFTRDYLFAFNQAQGTSKTATELIEKMKKKYPKLALDAILTLGAETALPKN